MHSDAFAKKRGFTLVELLAVVATIGILAALLLPVLSKAKTKAQRTACLYNLRQLSLCWTLYYNDNNGVLVESYPVNNTNAWVLGNMTVASEATDINLIRQSKLFAYNSELNLYRCPTDSGVLIDGKLTPSVRSYSMNGFLGARDMKLGPIPATADSYIWFFSKDSEIAKPSQMWVLLDEDERSINDGFFVTDPTAQRWIDFPANSAHRHNFSFGLTFADGHSDIWRRHADPPATSGIGEGPQPHSSDLDRLAGVSTSPK